MTQINLLPWREEIRAVNNRVFYAIAGIIMLFACLLVFAYHHWTLHQIEVVQANQAYIQTHEKTIETQVKEIRALDAEKSTLISQIKIIHALQGDRISIVKLFNTLVHSVPHGLTVTNLSRIKDKIVLTGTTQSNSDISNLISSLNNSHNFSSITLSEITKAADSKETPGNEEALNFKIELKQKADHTPRTAQ